MNAVEQATGRASQGRVMESSMGYMGYPSLQQIILTQLASEAVTCNQEDPYVDLLVPKQYASQERTKWI